MQPRRVAEPSLTTKRNFRRWELYQMRRRHVQWLWPLPLRSISSSRSAAVGDMRCSQHRASDILRERIITVIWQEINNQRRSDDAGRRVIAGKSATGDTTRASDCSVGCRDDAGPQWFRVTGGASQRRRDASGASASSARPAAFKGFAGS